MSVGIITVHSANPHMDRVCAWLRIHRLRPEVVGEVRLWPFNWMAVYEYLERDGRLYLERGFAEDDVWAAFRWRLMRVQLSPPLEWCEA